MSQNLKMHSLQQNHINNLQVRIFGGLLPQLVSILFCLKYIISVIMLLNMF